MLMSKLEKPNRYIETIHFTYLFGASSLEIDVRVNHSGRAAKPCRNRPLRCRGGNRGRDRAVTVESSGTTQRADSCDHRRDGGGQRHAGPAASATPPRTALLAADSAQVGDCSLRRPSDSSRS